MNDKELIEMDIDDWDIDYERWDKVEFASSISDYLEKYIPESHKFDQHLIAMLAIEMDTYVQCYLEVQKNGLVIEDAKGNLIGPSPYVRMMLKQLGVIRRLRKELKFLPKDRLTR